MNLFDEIQTDILGSAQISTILRKAKVLAYRLENQEFKHWVDFELSGYYGDNVSVPEYRKLETQSYGDFINLAWSARNVPIPLHNFPEALREINFVEMREGVRELESLMETASNSEHNDLRLSWPPELVPYLSNKVLNNMNCIAAWRVLTGSRLAQIIDDIRNRLLSFILEIAARYPDEAKSDFMTTKSIPDDQIRQVFNYYIMGNSHNIVSSSGTVLQGRSPSIFDQRNQNVNYQYNAAGDINLDNVNNHIEYEKQLEGLDRELNTAVEKGMVSGQDALDAQYNIRTAINAARQPDANGETVATHLRRASEVIQYVAQGNIALVNLARAIQRAGELAGRLF